jgi:histidinol phosphatase-like PHP family hydrolase
MEIVNRGKEDYHIHSLNFSDGMNTIEELVKYAGDIGLTKIAITDHCQVHIEKRNFGMKNYYSMLERWRNVHNNVEVQFGIEADLLNENGDVCFDIQGVTSEIIILSSHPAPIYSGSPNKITEGYVNAIERFHDTISFIGHPCAKYFENYIDIMELVKVCNKYEIPMEFNCANFVNERTNLANLKAMLENANQIYVNSDAHTLYELKTARASGFQYLNEMDIFKD